VAGKGKTPKKAAEARRAAAELRARQRAASRRKTILSVLGAVVLIALFAFAVMFIVKSSAEAYAVPDSGELKAPSLIDETEGIYVGPGGVAGGVPPEDAVRVDLVEDPICTACRGFYATAEPEVVGLIESGQIALYHHPVSIMDKTSLGTHYSTRMANAWFTVAEYDPEHYWAFIEVSYANAPDEGTKALTNDGIADLARQAGVAEGVIERFADGEFTQWVAEATDRAAETYKVYDPTYDAEVFGTPTLLVGGVNFPYWSTANNVTAAVNYVKENGAEAFALYLENPPEPSPSPSASASA
jgi:protein-disulfide isomerase